MIRFRHSFRCWLCACGISLTLFPTTYTKADESVGPQVRPLSPAESLAAFEVREGFRVELVVAEPLVRDPIAIHWGPDAKLWVAEMADYPSGVPGPDGTLRPGGRIRFLEDVDGDGRYDRSVVFLDGVPFPTSVAPWRDGVLVTSAPEVFYAEDTDGDGVADTKTVLYSGFVEGNQQHRVNGLEWGLDNWLYIANGDSGGTVRSHKTGREISISGRDLRVRPDSGALEAQIGQTQYGRSRDDWGNWIGCNSAGSWQYMLADHYLRRNPGLDGRGVRHRLTGGNLELYPISQVFSHFSDYVPPGPDGPHLMTAGCGIRFYRDRLFGEAFADAVFFGAAVHNLVHRFNLRRDGLTGRAQRDPGEQRSEFLASRDGWFRPTTTRTGPDGALWVVDMYRRVLEHPEWIDDAVEAKVNVRDGEEYGRIYRVVPIGAKLRGVPRLDRRGTSELVAALETPNGWQRDLAHQMLLWRDDRSAVTRLVAMARSSELPQAKVHALAVLDGLAAVKQDLLTAALRDAHAAVRRHAVRLSEPFLRSAALDPRLADGVLALVREESEPHVLRQLAYSLGEWTDPRASAALALLLERHGRDPHILKAALSSAAPHLPTLIALAFEADSARDEELVHTLREVLIRLVGSPAGRAHAGAVLLKLTGRKAHGSGGAETLSEEQFRGSAQLLDVLATPASNIQEVLAGIDSPPLLRAQIDALLETAATRVADSAASAEERSAAVGLLGRTQARWAGDAQLLGRQLVPGVPRVLQTAAVERLAATGRDETVESLLEHWDSYGPHRRQHVLDVLLRRTEYAAALLSAAATRPELRRALSAAQRGELLAHPDAGVRQRAGEIFAAVDPDRARLIARFEPALLLEGNIARGRKTFEKLCSSCHRLDGVGKEVGPQLTAFRDKSPRGFLTHILDPQQAVEAKYIQYAAILESGHVFTGILTRETSNSVTLLDARGQSRILLRSSVTHLQSTGLSLMPEGLEQGLDMAAMADLLTYLSRRAFPRKSFPNNAPELIAARDDGSVLLSASQSAIFGPSLVFEQRFRNLGYWSSADDRAEWTFELSRPGRYEVWVEWAVHENNAGDRFELRIGGERVDFEVESTGTWENYQRRRFGVVELESGRHLLVARSQGPVRRGAMIDLREVGLIPVREGAAR